VSPSQQEAARWGLGFGLGTQAVTVTSGLIWVLGGDAALGPFVGATIAQPLAAVSGIAGFEGVLRDGTLGGHYQGLGVGFLQGGIYGMSLGTLMIVGSLTRESVFEDLSFLFTMPAGVTYAGIGIGMMIAGTALLQKASNTRELDALSAGRRRVRLLPVFAPSTHGFQVGVHGVF